MASNLLLIIELTMLSFSRFNHLLSFITILLLASHAFAASDQSAPVKLSEEPDKYSQKMGVVYTALDQLAYNSITQGVTDSELLFEIKRNMPSCFTFNKDGLSCTSKIECHKDTKNNLLACPVSAYNEKTKQQEVLLIDGSDEFYIQVVLTYPRIISHEAVREIIAKSPVMNLESIQQD